MTDQNDIERYCRNCVSRDFVNGRGLVCKRTGAIPAFVGECESYQKDEELEKMAPTPKPEDYSGYVDRENCWLRRIYRKLYCSECWHALQVLWLGL